MPRGSTSAASTRSGSRGSGSISRKTAPVSTLDRGVQPGPLRDRRDDPADAIDWPAALDGAAWFHFTGITPALGAPTAASATAAALAAARAAGARVSVDLNFRRKLWTEARAREVMIPLVRNVDLVIANEEDLQSVLAIEVQRGT